MKNRWVYRILLGAIIAFGCARIISTYDDFWQTWDEPAHIACGLQWWEKGEYHYERFHPPLARVFMAAGPYFAGLRGLPGAVDHWIDGNTVLHRGGTYERNLALARLGILPFFVIASLVVAVWTLRCGGSRTSLVAVFLFGLLPPVLAHAGLATLDMACAAGVAASLYALFRWLENPSIAAALVFGLSAGLAVATKFTSIAFLGFAGLVIVAVYCSVRNRPGVEMPSIGARRIFVQAAVGAVAAFLSVWSLYRFSFYPLAQDLYGPAERFETFLSQLGALGPVVRAAATSIPLPAVDFLWGLFDLFYFRREDGHDVYFMDNVGKYGWWTFYPVVFLVKTPVGFLLLVAAGLHGAFLSLHRPDAFRSALTPFAAAGAVLFAGTIATPQNGLRQILPVYPLLAIVAASGVSYLWSNVRWQVATRTAAVLLVTSCAAVSFASHPRHLAYFNFLAGSEPEAIVNDSDLDWGQDLKLLSEACRLRGISRLHLRYNGSKGIDLSRFPFPEYQVLEPGERPSGWVAISAHAMHLGTGCAPYDQFAWLAREEVVEKVGSSILLYNIEP